MILIAICSFSLADNLPQSFKNYTKYTLKNDMGMALYLAPSLSKNAKKIHIKGNNYSSPKNSIKFGLQDRFVEISFSRGDSDDFNFEFRFSDIDYEENEALSIYADVLFVSANGFVYTKNTANEYFPKFQKFKLQGNTAKEIQQAFYKVNIPCKTSALTHFYSQKCKGGKRVATLAKNTPVKILLADNTNACPNERNSKEYLVETSFGLLGWVSSRGGYGQRLGNPLGCLMFNGD